MCKPNYAATVRDITPLGSSGFVEDPERFGENASIAGAIGTFRRTVLDMEMGRGIIRLTSV